MEFFLCVIGMVLVVEGIPLFLGPDKMKRVMLEVLELDDRTLRIFGAVIMIIGLVIVFLARRGLDFL